MLLLNYMLLQYLAYKKAYKKIICVSDARDSWRPPKDQTRLASDTVNVIGPLDQITLIIYIQLTHSFPGR